jgi:hypothetical protein
MRLSLPKALVTAAAAALFASSIAALAANTTFFTSIGDLQFPFVAPANNGAIPGNIDNMVIGANVPQPGTISQLHVDSGNKTATAVAGAATLNKTAGVVTSESLTTAVGAIYTLTLTDTAIASTDQVMATVQPGTSTTGTPSITTVDPAAGQLVIKVKNIDSTNAFNGTLLISFVAFKN